MSVTAVAYRAEFCLVFYAEYLFRRCSTQPHLNYKRYIVNWKILYKLTKAFTCKGFVWRMQ